MRRLLVIAFASLALAGCGQATTDRTEEFQGEERAVAQVVEDLQVAGERSEADRICRDILLQDLTTRLNSAGTTCTREIERSIDDADDFELVVEDVTVSGNRATATVRRGEGEREGRATFEFQKVGRAWRASSLAG